MVKGVWQVSEAHTNSAATSIGHYIWNDPRLVGRIFSFDDAVIRNNTPEFDVCAVPTFHPINFDLGGTIQTSMGGYGYPPVQPTASDYRIAPGDGKSRSIFEVRCGTTPWHNELGVDPIRGVWIAKLGTDQIALRWFGETVLTLHRVVEGAKPNPSFSCVKASSAAERTICSSYELSAFDQSVSTAYVQLLKQAKVTDHETAGVVADQGAWLKLRNRCLTSRECLIKSMRNRLEVIVSKIQT